LVSLARSRGSEFTAANLTTPEQQSRNTQIIFTHAIDPHRKRHAEEKRRGEEDGRDTEQPWLSLTRTKEETTHPADEK